jgi:tetratricopeptide (TPR) repeat protein
MRLGSKNQLYILLLFATILSSCSNQESWAYKEWHNTLAHYNTFFNAEQKWLETVETTREGYKDDFRKPLSLINYGTIDILKGNQAAMDEVIKKASTMIDKHPRSKWVDDAYLLNGKAYFMKGEISAAIDLFEFVQSHFTDPKIQFSAQLWIARSFYVKGQYVDAEILVQNALKNPEFPNTLATEANYLLGAMQFALGKYSQAAAPLEIALLGKQTRMDKYRLHFALGHCYITSKEYDKAEIHYSKISKLNPPYELAFHARMSQVNILSAKQENYTKANKVLGKMLKDDKNADYLGTIYISMGENELKAQNVPMAVKRFNQAIQLTQNNEHKTNAYLSLGNYYFINHSYEQAAKYYDSANNIIDKSHPDFEAIVQRNDILSDLLKEVLTISDNDSLLRMAKDPDWRSKKIAEAIEREKKAQDAAIKAQNIANQQKANSGFQNPGMGGPGGNPNTGMGNPMDNLGTSSTNSSFPFYNPANRTKGQQEFVKNWGTRENRDFWKYNSKKVQSDINANPNPGTGPDSSTTASTNKTNKKENTNIDTTAIPTNISAGEKKYYVDLPLTSESQKKNQAEVATSLFEAAKIYQDRLIEISEAIRLFTELVRRFPESENTPQALYELVKLNKQIGDYSQADEWKAQLYTKHGKSVYVRMLETGGSLSELAQNASGNQAIDSMFEKMVDSYNKGNYAEALAIKQASDKNFAGNYIQTKFDYVQSLCFIKKGDIPKGISLLEQLVLDYPSSEISLRARDIIEAQQRLKLESEVTAGNTGSNGATAGAKFKTASPKDPLDVIFVFAKGTNANMIRAAISDFDKKQFSFENLAIASPLLIGSNYVIHISQFSTNAAVKDYTSFINKATADFAAKGLFEYNAISITEANFIELTKSMDLNGYRQFSAKQ